MKYLIRRYYPGYCTYEVEAENEELAFNTARNLPIDENEILSTLEDWQLADEIEVIAGLERQAERNHEEL